MMRGKAPNANPRHYLLTRAAGRAALDKLSLRYPDPVKWIHQEQTLNDRIVRKGDYPIHPTSVPSDFWPEVNRFFGCRNSKHRRTNFVYFKIRHERYPGIFQDPVRIPTRISCIR